MRMFGNESKRACSISLFGLWSFSDLGVRLGSRIFVDFVDWIGLRRGGLGRGLDLDLDVDWTWTRTWTWIGYWNHVLFSSPGREWKQW